MHTVYNSTRYYQLRQAIDSALEAFSHLSLQLDNAIMAAGQKNKSKTQDFRDFRMPTRNNLLVGNLQNKSFIIAKALLLNALLTLKGSSQNNQASVFSTGQYIFFFSELAS